MRRSALLSLALVVVIALALRLVPYIASPYPYNVDGYPLARGAERALEEGHWTVENSGSGIEAYNAKMPGFSLLLAHLAALTGIPPLRAVQLLTPLLGLGAVLLGFALARRLTGSMIAGLGCALFLAMHGFFVYLTAAAMKEALGLPLLILLFLLYKQRSEPRCRMLSAIILLLLPLVHHLTALIAFLYVGMTTAAHLIQRWRSGELRAHIIVEEACLGPALGIFALAYYHSVSMEFYTGVSNMHDLALLSAITFLAMVLCVILSLPALSKPWFLVDVSPGRISSALLFDEKSLAVLICFGVLALNSRILVFQGTILTTTALLIGVLPLVPLALLAIAGYNLIRYSAMQERGAVAAMALAPIVLLVFSIARGLDPFSFALAYRAVDYLDPFLALGAGVGLAFLMALAGRRWAARKAWRFSMRAVTCLAFVLLLAASASLAYSGDRLYGVRNDTDPHEFTAGVWASEHGLEPISTNSRLYEIYAPYFELSCDSTLPYRLREGMEASGHALVLSDEWTSLGAQGFFSSRIVVPEQRFNEALDGGHKVYSAGHEGAGIHIVMGDEG
ncbi:MAG: hypothetical protein AB1665_06415 [Candidatus Thermoplasmatota archaeon]